MTLDSVFITWTDNSTTPATVTTSAPITLSHAGMQQMLGWASATFFPLGVLVSGVAGGTGSNAPVYRAATGQDVANALAQSIFQGEMANAIAWLKSQAAIAAANAVAPIS